MGFPRQEYWSGLPFPLLRDLPDPGIEPVSPALAGGFFITEPHGKPICKLIIIQQEFSFASSFTSQAEKAVAPDSSTFAWKTPWTEEPGRL